MNHQTSEAWGACTPLFRRGCNVETWREVKGGLLLLQQLSVTKNNNNNNKNNPLMFRFGRPILLLPRLNRYYDGRKWNIIHSCDIQYSLRSWFANNTKTQRRKCVWPHAKHNRITCLFTHALWGCVRFRKESASYNFFYPLYHACWFNFKWLKLPFSKTRTEISPSQKYSDP